MAARWCLRSIAALALAAAVLVAAAADDARPASQPPRDSHVLLVVLENRELDEVIGSSEAPYINRLAGRGALATNYHAVTHPSLPNYLALLGGSTFGVKENCTECEVAGPSLASQLTVAGVHWRAYMGGMPSPCFGGAEHGDYVKRHNPFMYFPAISSRPSRCARVVPETRLLDDLRRHALPDFAWLSPDLCDNAHDCGLDVADDHLSRLLPRVLRQLGPEGLLIVTFDEGTSDAGCCGGAGGGRVMTLVVGPGVRPGARLRAAYDHYSLLAALEERFDLPRLRHARTAHVLRGVLGRG